VYSVVRGSLEGDVVLFFDGLPTASIGLTTVYVGHHIVTTAADEPDLESPDLIGGARSSVLTGKDPRATRLWICFKPSFY